MKKTIVISPKDSVAVPSGTFEYSYNKKEIPDLSGFKSRKVKVYQRGSGEVGIRNELWVIPTVGCVNSQAKVIVQEFLAKHPKTEELTEFSPILTPTAVHRSGTTISVPV